MGPALLLLCFILVGCGNDGDPGDPAEIERAEKRKKWYQHYYPELFKPRSKSPKVHNRASSIATPGRPGQTSYSLTEPNGASTSVTVVGFANDGVVVDLDNDGFGGDAAFTITERDVVTVVRLVGTTLQPPVEYPLGDGASPVAVAAGDVNGDNLVDLVTANAGDFVTGSVSLLLATGDAAFAAATVLASGQAPSDVELGDFNGDGRLDLAVADGVAPRVLVRFGTGTGTFGPEVSVATVESAPLALQVGDFNGSVDSHDDIVTNGSVLLGRGDGSFSPPLDITQGFNPRMVKVVDVNSDGRFDIILGSQLPNLIAVLFGNGDGSVGAAQHYILYSSPQALAYADFTGDDVADLLVTNAGDDPSQLAGRKDGTFTGVQAIPVDPKRRRPVGSGVEAAVADFTGDSLPDIVLADGDMAFLLPGQSDGSQGTPLSIPGRTGYRSRVAIGDWNRDTKLDLAFVGTANTFSNSPLELTINLGLGGGAFAPASAIDLRVTRSAQTIPPIVTASLNDDLNPDLLVANFDKGGVSVFLGDGAGGFAEQPRVETNPEPPFGSGAGGIVVGDFNGDQRSDLAVAVPGAFGRLEGFLKVALGNGDGTFQPPQILRHSITGKGLACADLNADGRLDLAVAIEGPAFDWDVEIYLGRGDGTFDAPKRLGLNQDLISDVVVLDGDQDGTWDLAVPHADELLLLRGVGNNYVPVQSWPTGGDKPLFPDLNHDGWPDLLSPTTRGFLAVRINPLPKLPEDWQLLGIARKDNRVLVEWPEFYPDYVLEESPDLRVPFTDSDRPVIVEDGTFRVTIDPSETKTRYFRLEPKP